MLARYALTFGGGADRNELRRRAQAEGLPICVERAGLLFVAEERTPYRAGDRSLIVGEIYSADTLAADLDADGFRPEHTLGASGQWGNFALFDSAAQSIYRDPSGAVSVYHCAKSGGDVFVSDAELALRLGLLAGTSADVTFAVHWLQYPFLRTRNAGIERVTEILPGTRRAKHPSGEWRETCLWRPARFIRRSDAITDDRQAIAALRSCLLEVVAAQCRHRSSLLQLSGGLDSSLIAVCLHCAGADFGAANFATRSAEGDERRYARDAAACSNAVLLEILEPECTSLEPVPTATFRPMTNPLLRPFQSAIEAAARQSGRSVLIDGGGGDNVFCYVTSAAPVVDAFLWGGRAAGVAAIADVAARANSNLWQVAAAALRRFLRPIRGWKEDRSFLNREALLDGCEPHPWLDGLGRALPGKREHVRALIDVQHFLDRGTSSSVRRLHPLMAQPLLELCLRIPSWMWIRGGRDRSLARDAFEDLLPPSVFRRRAKGSLESLFHRSFATLRDHMRETLLSGELRRSGILDAASVEQALQGDDRASDDVELRISELVALDQWLGDWRSRAPSRAKRA
jgi:asparagine synthase (glutamine-hydrolysing)